MFAVKSVDHYQRPVQQKSTQKSLYSEVHHGHDLDCCSKVEIIYLIVAVNVVISKQAGEHKFDTAF